MAEDLVNILDIDRLTEKPKALLYKMQYGFEAEKNMKDIINIKLLSNLILYTNAFSTFSFLQGYVFVF